MSFTSPSQWLAFVINMKKTKEDDWNQLYFVSMYCCKYNKQVAISHQSISPIYLKQKLSEFKNNYLNTKL